MILKNHPPHPRGGNRRRTPASTCPLCGSSDLSDFFEVKQLPISVCYLWDIPAQARNAPRGDICLSHCHRCGFISNRWFEPDNSLYVPGYEASLIYSDLFCAYVRDLVSRLIRRYDIRHKRVLEIGCGSGDFLRLLCKLGNNDGIGIDPTLRKSGIETEGQGSIRFIRDYFGEPYAHLAYDFVCCRSVFENIPDPLKFLKNIYQGIGHRDDVRLYFEVPNSIRYFANSAPWSIYYEQCNHFTQVTLTQIFTACGFEVLDAGTCYENGEYVYVEAMPGRTPDSAVAPSSKARINVPPAAAEFSQIHREHVKKWTARLTKVKQSGRRVVAWGSGGKGINFLNTLATEDIIPYVVDINPNRHGKYVPGSAQKVVAPEFLVDYRPELIIITNPLYEREIKAQVQKLGIPADFQVV